LIKTRVVLPKMLWSHARDKQHLKQLISSYMQRYEGYEVVEVGKYYAICKSGRI